MVKGDRGVRRWQVTNQVQRQEALETVQDFFSGMNKAFNLKREARVSELFLVYLPYWHVHASVGGWLFGRVKSGDDQTKPIEVEVMEEMEWGDAATDVAEFGVHRVSIKEQHLEPYNPEQLHAEGMVFEPVESRSDALDEAHQHFAYRVRTKRDLKQRYFEKTHVFREQLSLVYYPLWVARYEYRNRNYQVVIDGVSGKIFYGKAPGNVFYRAAMLVAAMAIGNFILVNGTIIAGRIIAESSDDDSFFLLALPLAIGIGIIAAGYHRFRHGEEVEFLQKGAGKAALSRRDEPQGFFPLGSRFIEMATNIENYRR
jgi:hypothetical protein